MHGIYSGQSKYSLVRGIFDRILCMEMLVSAWRTASKHPTLRYTPLYFQYGKSVHLSLKSIHYYKSYTLLNKSQHHKELVCWEDR